MIEAHSSHAAEPALVKAMLVAALFPNVALIRYGGGRYITTKVRTREDGQVKLHPSSLLATPSSECVTMLRARVHAWSSSSAWMPAICVRGFRLCVKMCASYKLRPCHCKDTCLFDYHQFKHNITRLSRVLPSTQFCRVAGWQDRRSGLCSPTSC